MPVISLIWFQFAKNIDKAFVHLLLTEDVIIHFSILIFLR